MIYYDLDGVLFDFTGHFYKYLGLPDHEPVIWDDPRIREHFHLIETDHEFWLTIPAYTNKLPYPPLGYVTTRPVPSWVSAEALWKAGFDYAPVYTGRDKTAYIPKGSVMVDDAAHNFEELTAAGVKCYLLDKAYNQHVETDMRIYNLDEIKL